MIKKVTLKWLNSWNACENGIEWFESQKETNPIKLLKKLVRLKEYSHTNYSIVQVMTVKQKRQYAVYAAKQVLSIYEKEHPNDNRPRKAIEAAEKVIKRNTKENRAAARAARAAARAAAWAAGDAAWVAGAAAWAAGAAGDADGAAKAAARAAAWAAARAAMMKRILNYGIKILEGKE